MEKGLLNCHKRETWMFLQGVLDLFDNHHLRHTEADAILNISSENCWMPGRELEDALVILRRHRECARESIRQS